MTDSDSRVFGTPPEPYFNHDLSGVTTEMLEEWMSVLLKQNAQAVKTATPEMHSAISLDVIQFLFLTCENLKMSSEVKYSAVELFDRFMIKHMEDLHNHVQKTSSIKTQTRDWQEILKRVSNQILLRIVSCIQIASKLTSHNRVLSPCKARRYLLKNGHRYNLESITQSELRILKTINFCVSKPSPLVYMETLLEMLGRSDGDLEVKQLYGVAQSLLDMVYLRHEHVYDKLHQVVTEGSPLKPTDSDQFASVRVDKMLLVATVITTATYIIDRDNHEKVRKMLSKITHIPRVDIMDFMSVLLQILKPECDVSKQLQGSVLHVSPCLNFTALGSSK